MIAPLITEAPEGVKDRLIRLLNAIEYGLYPGDGITDDERQQAMADTAVVSAAVTEVQDAATDLDADRAFMVGMARLAGAGRRYRIAAGHVQAAAA